MRTSQQGITFFKFIGTVAVVVGIALLGIRVFPVYINYYNVHTAIKSLRNLPKDALGQSPVKAKTYLRKYLSRQLYLNDVRFITPKQIEIKRDKRAYHIVINYIVEQKLVGHVYLLFKFKPSYAISIEG